MALLSGNRGAGREGQWPDRLSRRTRENIMAKYVWLGGLLVCAFAASYLVFAYGPGLFKGASPGDAVYPVPLYALP